MSLPILEVFPSYWERAGKKRDKILARKLRARDADAFIAQICLDYSIALITRELGAFVVLKGLLSLRLFGRPGAIYRKIKKGT